MSIKSYIIHCEQDKKGSLFSELQKLSNCEVIPAQNHEVIIVVTDTDSDESDNQLYNQLLEMKGLKHMSLVSGFDPK
ncbi:periplasmic nitrate reductase chaperone NapD [Lutibacter agarilyticus]|uniref:Periplasmic nitrate reductase chaperone NapD n=1 Tax=Lutibacter agarilyticus TaxID=1109740 RepID=A0A238Z3B1_9FLAO|nr:chaperone NapD [Lutibacter agarilyticus]SNR77468.1 periplasmic nitrate reductase chaperone NapD [Lutibacter agarilyticus]